VKKFKSLMEKVSFTKGIAGLAMAVAVFSLASLASYAAEGKVTADTAKIRAEANTSSEVVGSTSQGKVIELLGAVKDSSGMTWYKVSVTGGGYGYIRSDLVSTNDTVPAIEGTSTQTTTQSTQSSQPAETVPTSIGEQQATIKSETNVRIRSGASTQHSVVTSLPNGTEITLIGEASDSAGNKWYQLRCNYNGRDVEGYVRSDLLTIGGAVEETPAEETPTEGENAEGTEAPAEEAPVEETPAETVPEHNDYQIVYTQNSEGEYEYYLYDNINGTRQKLAEILTVVDTAVASNQALTDKVNQNKLIIIILAVIIVLLFAALTVLLFKLRDFYYEEYDEEEEEEEEEEPVPVRRKVKRPVEEEEDDYVPVKKKKVQASSEQRPSAQGQRTSGQERKPSSQGQKSSAQGQRTSAQGQKPASQGQKVRVKREDDAELYAAEKKAPVKKTPARKPQNFLVDDDEFEFEFLNIDDKDL